MIETIQLGMAAELLDHAPELLDDVKAGAGELRFLANRLRESLGDVLRVAESRGERLEAYELDAEESGAYEDDDVPEGQEPPPNRRSEPARPAS
ncbi:hypothetical protein ACFU99_11625 [Streptomyces sp. NPDC057654]|uniref:hypothetical protein n=1 Tax=Streptomyces sp. NPDC057654 TaxID=3346196 RepID=UPI0036937DF0